MSQIIAIVRPPSPSFTGALSEHPEKDSIDFQLTLEQHRAYSDALQQQGLLVIALDPEGILVACADGTLEIQEIQESGRKRVAARDFISGRRVALGDRFGDEGASE